MKVILDRFEGDYGIVELPDKSFIEIPKVLISSAKEGDIITIDIDNEESDKQKKEIETLMNELFQ